MEKINILTTKETILTDIEWYESKNLYDVLENDLIPSFYNRQDDNLPRGWISMMKNSMRKLGPLFSTNRMVKEYTETYYMKAFDNWKSLSKEDFTKTKSLVQWKQYIKANWDKVKIHNSEISESGVEVGVALKVKSEIYLGNLNPEDVIVQIYSGPLDTDRNIIQSSPENMI